MPDVLTHVLVGYSIGTLLAIRYERVRPAHVTLAMIGALSPDFMKISLLFPGEFVAFVLGVPFSWSPLHTLGGTVIVICLGALFVPAGHRRRAIALIALGAASHHVLDVLLLTVTDTSYAVLWPLSTYRFPSLDLYLSSDRWPALVAGTIAAALWIVRRRDELPTK